MEKILEKESNENYLPEKNNENGDIENNMIVLTTTNNNQQITNKDYTNNENNSQFQKQNIYIHCHSGNNRSAIICACYLIYTTNENVNDVIRYIKEK